MRSFAALLLCLAAAVESRPAQQLRGRTLADWRATIEPSPEELEWTAIPWRASFFGALAEAQASGRPILLWAMNGHPLGCT
jgi:hypothetical protein